MLGGFVASEGWLAVLEHDLIRFARGGEYARTYGSPEIERREGGV